jgi:hypothetical protein
MEIGGASVFGNTSGITRCKVEAKLSLLPSHLTGVRGKGVRREVRGRLERLASKEAGGRPGGR